MSNYDELLSKMTRKNENKTSKSRDSTDRGADRGSDKEKFATTIDREGIDYYAILGVTSDADTKRIKSAYHKRLRK